MSTINPSSLTTKTYQESELYDPSLVTKQEALRLGVSESKCKILPYVDWNGPHGAKRFAKDTIAAHKNLTLEQFEAKLLAVREEYKDGATSPKWNYPPGFKYWGEEKQAWWLNTHFPRKV